MENRDITDFIYCSYCVLLTVHSVLWAFVRLCHLKNSSKLKETKKERKKKQISTMDPYRTNMMDHQPSILVRLVHSVPHINTTLHRVNSTFDPKSVIYKEVSLSHWIYFSFSLQIIFLAFDFFLFFIHALISFLFRNNLKQWKWSE